MTKSCPGKNTPRQLIGAWEPADQEKATIVRAAQEAAAQVLAAEMRLDGPILVALKDALSEATFVDLAREYVRAIIHDWDRCQHTIAPVPEWWGSVKQIHDRDGVTYRMPAGAVDSPA